MLDELHQQARLYVNFFLLCCKLESKTRHGSKVTKKYERPVTPYERLLASTGVTEIQKEALRATFATLDPESFNIGSRRWKCRIATLRSTRPSQN